MALEEAVVRVTHAKVNVFGETGSGKTVTEALLGLYLSKTYHNSAPVAMWSSEPGVDYIIDFYKAEGVKLFVDRDKSFTSMLNSAFEAQRMGCCVFMGDSLTHAWRDLVNSFCVKRNIKKPEFQHWGEIKGPENWGKWSDFFVSAQMHILTCGRAGYEYDNELDDEGKQQLIKGDSKMKAEGEFGYEADLLVEMTHSTDKVEKRREMMRKRSTRNRAMADDGKNPIGMHFALVKKSRVWELNDKLFPFPNQPRYEQGYFKAVGEPFRPYFEWLAKNRKNLEGTTRPVVNAGANSQDRFTDSQFDSKGYKRKCLFEEFGQIMAELFDMRKSVGKHANLVVGRGITGEASPLKFRAKATEEVEYCVRLLKQFEKRFKAEQVPIEKEEDLLALVDIAREEITFEDRQNQMPPPTAEGAAASAAMQDVENAVF